MRRCAIGLSRLTICGSSLHPRTGTQQTRRSGKGAQRDGLAFGHVLAPSGRVIGAFTPIAASRSREGLRGCVKSVAGRLDIGVRGRSARPATLPSPLALAKRPAAQLRCVRAERYCTWLPPLAAAKELTHSLRTHAVPRECP